MIFDGLRRSQGHTVSAKYIMKCDDDTFVRVDAVINEARKVPEGRSFYIGNINYYHKPLRNGKWAVTYEVSVDKSGLLTLIFLSSSGVIFCVHGTSSCGFNSKQYSLQLYCANFNQVCVF